MYACNKPLLLKKVQFIINPAAGKETPITDIINDVFAGSGIPFSIAVSQAADDIFTLVSRHRQEAQLLAVYGGDGTVMEAARALYNSPTPLFIIPGGTANVMAKELNIPVDSKAALQLLLSGDYAIKAIDMGLVNGCPFLIRVNLGILADMITETSPEMKERWGQWAYGLTAFQNLPEAGTPFRLRIDGKEYEETAVALTVTNAGNIGREGYSFLPGIRVDDGLLDVISMSDADLWSLLKVTGSMLLQKDSATLQHRRAKEIHISAGGPLHFLCDDKAQTADALHIQVTPGALQVAVPQNKGDE